MKYRTCPACRKEIDNEAIICEHCNKGVFVVDFGDSGARLFDKFKLNVYEICGWHDIVVPEGQKPPKPPREWKCVKYEPVVFVDR